MLRSAAKNHRSVTVVTDPADYDAVLAEMRANGGDTTLALRERLAVKTYQATSSPTTTAIAALPRPRRAAGNRRRVTTCRCRSSAACATARTRTRQASLYGDFENFFQKLHGKELSYNNILDISAAAQLIGEFEDATVAILKHTNPCGVGSDPDLREAWDKAFATDKQAPVRRHHHLQPPADRSVGARP